MSRNYEEQMNNLTSEQKKRYEAATKALEGGELTGEQLVAQQEMLSQIQWQF